jgi:hypothetical protein
VIVVCVEYSENVVPPVIKVSDRLDDSTWASIYFYSDSIILFDRCYLCIQKGDLNLLMFLFHTLNKHIRFHSLWHSGMCIANL